MFYVHYTVHTMMLERMRWSGDAEHEQQIIVQNGKQKNEILYSHLYKLFCVYKI